MWDRSGDDEPLPQTPFVLGIGVPFLPAGLLRRSAIDDPTGLGVAAAIVVLSRIIGAGIRFALRALDAGGRRARA